MQGGQGDVTAEFAALVERQATLYFEDLLPRCLARWYRGGGYLFALRLLEGLDADTFDEPLADPPPPRWARRWAARARRNCPLFAFDRPLLAPRDGVLLGQFRAIESYVQHSPVYSQTLSESRWVELYEHGFLLLAPPTEAALEREVMRTIVHEYLHFFEFFLPRRDQALRGREEWDAAVRRRTVEDARRRDHRIVWRRWIGRGLLAACALFLVGALLWEYGGLRKIRYVEDPHSLVRLAVARARLGAERDRLAGIAAAPDTERVALAEVEEQLAALRDDDPAASPERAVERIAAVVAPATAARARYGDTVDLTGTGGGAALGEALSRAARAVPTLTVRVAEVHGGRFAVGLEPPDATLRPTEETAALKAGDREAPLFSGDAEEALRATLVNLEDELAGLRRTLGPLAELPARRRELASRRAQAWAGETLGQAACLLLASGETAVGRQDGSWVFMDERAMFVGPLHAPTSIVESVGCPAGRWQFESAEEQPSLSGAPGNDVRLSYAFMRSADPRPWGTAAAVSTVMELLPPKR